MQEKDADRCFLLKTAARGRLTDPFAKAQAAACVFFDIKKRMGSEDR
jgi:hypothetical protein